MRFSLLAVVAAIPLALASPVELDDQSFALEARAADKSARILQLLKKTVKDTNTLDATLNMFADDGNSIPYLVDIVNESQTISDDLQNTTTVAMASTDFSDAGAQAILLYTRKTVVPTTVALLQNFIDHYPSFNNSGLAGAVMQNLQSQYELVREEAKNVSSKTPQPYRKKGIAPTKKIYAAFKEAIAVYGQDSS